MKALKRYTEGRRPAGRPRGRWRDAVDRNAKRMFKCKNWRRKLFQPSPDEILG